MKITTDATTTVDAKAHDLDDALAALQRGAYDGGRFVLVERDGSDDALQMRTLALERVRDGRVFRASVPPAVVALFRAYAAGETGWDRGIEWTEITKEARDDSRRLTIVSIIGGVIGTALVLGWFLWTRARG